MLRSLMRGSTEPSKRRILPSRGASANRSVSPQPTGSAVSSDDESSGARSAASGRKLDLVVLSTPPTSAVLRGSSELTAPPALSAPPGLAKAKTTNWDRLAGEVQSSSKPAFASSPSDGKEGGKEATASAGLAFLAALGSANQQDGLALLTGLSKAAAKPEVKITAHAYEGTLSDGSKGAPQAKMPGGAAPL